MQSNEKLLLNFIRSISDINRFLSEKIRFLSLKTLRGKIAAYLLSASMTQDNTLKVRIKESRQELSEKFGVSRQSLARSISELEDEGILTASARTITILDKNKLRNCE
jgi:CRP-like cAMP-binding protein